MIDFINLKPSQAYLTDEAVDLKTTREGFRRCANTTGKLGGGTIVLKFEIERYAVLTVTAIRVQDGRWWVKHIKANLPALLYGHNGCQLATLRDLHLALTRLRHIVSMVTTPACHDRLIPGIGSGNDGFIDAVEAMIQFDYPDRRFLVGSHFARLKNQQKPTGVYFRQSSTFGTRELILSIYDKLAQLWRGVADPETAQPTRVEARFRDEERLAKDVRKTGIYFGSSGPLLATLSPDTAYALVQLTLSRLTGFGWLSEIDSLQALPKAARLIAASLADLIHEPHRLDLAIENYRLVENPCPRTLQDTESKLRAYALRAFCGDPRKIIPPDRSELPRADVRLPDREKQFSLLMRDIGAPVEPDQDIVEAWSRTTFLPAIPSPGAVFGSVAPAPPIFRTQTL